MAGTSTTTKPRVKRMTKAQIIGELADRTELSKRDVTRVLDELKELVKRELTGRGRPGEFVVPDLLKLTVKKVPVRKARLVKNNFTGEMVQSPARPASKKVRAAPLKKLKDLVS